MLTRPVAAVKFDLSSTPEQAACAMKIDEGLKTFWNVVEHMQHAADRQSTDSSGRGDHFPGSLGDRELAAPSVLGYGRYWGRRPDAEGRE